MTNQTGTYEIRSQYNDTGNVLASTTFIVRNRTSTGTVYYNSSSTASNAMFTMPTNASTFNDTFYCEFIYTSNDGNINNYIKVLATADIFTFPHPAKDNFRNPFTFAWIIFFIMFVFALSLNIATADVGTLLLVGFAIFVAKVGWIEIAWAALSIALLIAIFKLLRNEGDR